MMRIKVKSSLIFLLFLFSLNIQAQLVVIDTLSDHALIERLAGPGITISNVKFDCPSVGYGGFDATNADFPLTAGTLLTTGRLIDAIGPNIEEGITHETYYFGDDLLGELVEYNNPDIYDGCTVTFDVEVAADSIAFEYVFASDEYPEFNCTKFNDVFALFISGPGIDGMKNLAIVPGTEDLAVAINTINDGVPGSRMESDDTCRHLDNTAYYIDNSTLNIHRRIEYDGYTVPLVAKTKVIPCETYELKLTIADIGDPFWDSGIFIKDGSLVSNLPKVSLTVEGTDQLIEGCVDGALVFTLDMPATDTMVIYYDILGTAQNGIDYSFLPDSMVFYAGETTKMYAIESLTDDLQEGQETIGIHIQNNNTCTFTMDSLQLPWLKIKDDFEVITNETVIYTCTNSATQLYVDGGNTYEWIPSDFLDDPTSAMPICTPENDIEYKVIVRGGNCVDTAFFSIKVNNQPFEENFSLTYSFCTPRRILLQGPSDLVNNPNASFEWAITGGDLTGSYDCSTCLNTFFYPAYDGAKPTSSALTHHQLEIQYQEEATYCTYSYDITTNSAGTELYYEHDTLKICDKEPTQIDIRPPILPYFVYDTYTWTPTEGLSCSDCPDPVINVATETVYQVTIEQQNIADTLICQETIYVTVVPYELTATIDGGEVYNTCGLPRLGTPAQAGLTYQWLPNTALNSDTVAQPHILLGELDNQITYTLVVTDEYGCTATDTLTINKAELSTPTIEVADSSVVVCKFKEPFSFDLPSEYTYTWLPSEGLSCTDCPNPTVIAEETIVYQVIVAKESCLDTIYQTVIVRPPIRMDAGEDEIDCLSYEPYWDWSYQLGSTELDGYAYEWSPSHNLEATNIGMPYVNVPTEEIPFSQVYTLVVTDEYGCTATDDVLVEVTMIPTELTEFRDSTITTCSNDTIQLTAPKNEEYEYRWSPRGGLSCTTCSNPTAVITEPITYQVDIFKGECMVTVARRIEVNAPTINMDNEVNITCEEQIMIGAETIDGITYQWLPTIGLSNASIAQPTVDITQINDGQTYTLVVTGDNGCTNSQEVSINIANSSGDIELQDGEITICQGATTQFTLPEGYQYTWQPTIGLSCSDCPNPTIITEETVTYEVTATKNGCHHVTSQTVIVNTSPIADAGSISMDCESINMQLGVPLVEGYTYSWIPAIGLDKPDIAQPTVVIPQVPFTQTYTLVVTNENGCTAMDEVIVNIEEEINLFEDLTSNTTTICSGENTSFSLPTQYAYTWQPTIGLSCADCPNPTIITEETITYEVTATKNGCHHVTSQTVIVNSSPIADAGSISMDCESINMQLGVPLVEGYTYSWTPAIGLDKPDIAQPTVVIPQVPFTQTYTLVVTNENGCTAMDEVIVNIEEEINLFEDLTSNTITICSGENTSFSLPTQYAYTWQPTIGLSCSDCPNPTITTEETITYEVTATENGCSKTVTQTVMVSPKPIANAGNVAPQCGTFSSQLGVPAVNGLTYNWTPNIGLEATNIAQPTVTIDELPFTQTYTLIVTNENGCTATDEVTVTAFDYPSISIEEVDTIIVGNSTPLTVLTTTEQLTYSWIPAIGLNDPFIANPIATPITDTKYTVTVSNEQGCTATASIWIAVKEEVVDTVTNGNEETEEEEEEESTEPTEAVKTTLLIPTAFSPNGDGINDFFKVVGKNVVLQELLIYNRWGKVVHENPKDIHIGWDGYHRNRPQPIGTYVYYITYKEEGSEEIKFQKGNITLIR